MTTRRIRGGPGWAGYPAALFTLALMAAVITQPARAADPGAPTGTSAEIGLVSDPDEGWKKVLAFARCAVHVFRAVTPGDWTIAFLDCGRLYLEEPPLPGGGQP